MFFDRFDKDFDSLDLNLAKTFRNRCTKFRSNSSSSAIGNVFVLVQRTEITTNRDITVLELKTNPCCFQSSTSDFVLERVVTKESQMPGARARS